MVLSVFRLSLILNNKCNLKCSYCFQHDEFRHDITLSDDNIVKVCEFVRKYGNVKDKKLELTIIGGEPSLYSKFDTLYEILYNELVMHGFTFSIVRVFTNGIVVNREMIEFMLKIKHHSSILNIYITKNLISDLPDRFCDNLNSKIDETTSMYRSYGLSVYHQYVFTKTNVDKYREILDHALIDNDVKIEFGYPCVDDLDDRDFHHMIITFLDFIQTRDDISYDFVERVGMIIPSDSSDYVRDKDVMCDPIKGELSISPLGYIIPCVKCLDIESEFNEYHVDAICANPDKLNDDNIQRWISYEDVNESGYKCNECPMKHYCNPCRLLLDIIDRKHSNIKHSNHKCQREIGFAYLKYKIFSEYIKNGGKNVWLEK